MKEKIKRFLTKHWWIILIILGIIGWFYWFQVRPSMIYSICHNQAILSIKPISTQGGYFARKILEKNVFPWDNYEAYYKTCLRSRGINK